MKFICSLILFCATLSFAQHNYCSHDLLKHHPLNKHSSSQEEKIREVPFSDDLIMFPVKFHIVRKADGTTPYFLDPTFSYNGERGVDSMLNILNHDFEQVGIRFYRDPEINYIDDDGYFEEISSSEMFTIANAHNQAKSMNIYLCSGLAIGYGGAIDGNNGFVFLGGILPYLCQVLAHEVGHYFDLDHTFGCVGCQRGLADGSDCDQPFIGDGFCDTPPDHENIATSADCEVLSQYEDEVGNIYAPDPHNLMSYHSYSCLYRFSDEQIAHMRYRAKVFYASFFQDGNYRANFSSCRSLASIGTPVRFFEESASSDTLNFEWTFEGGVPAQSTDPNPMVVFPQEGVFDVKLKVSNAHGSDSLTIENYMKVMDQAIVPPYANGFESPEDMSDVIFSVRERARMERNDSLGKGISGAFHTWTPQDQAEEGSFLFDDDDVIFRKNHPYTGEILIPIDATAMSQLELAFDVKMNYDYMKEHTALQLSINGIEVGELMWGSREWVKVRLNLDSLAGSKFDLALRTFTFTKDNDSRVAFYKIQGDNEIIIDNLQLNGRLVLPDFMMDRATFTCTGNPFTFHNTTVDSVDSFLWDFGVDAEPQFVTDVNPPEVIWTEPGNKVIRLSAIKDGVTYTEEKEDIVVVGDNSGLEIQGPDTVCAYSSGNHFFSNYKQDAFYIYFNPEGVIREDRDLDSVWLQWSGQDDTLGVYITHFDDDRGSFCQIILEKVIRVIHPQETVLSHDKDGYCEFGEGLFGVNEPEAFYDFEYFQNQVSVAIDTPQVIVTNLQLGDEIVVQATDLRCNNLRGDTLVIGEEELACVSSVETNGEALTYFPNPATDFVIFSEAPQWLELTSVDGTSYEVEAGGPRVDVSTLPKGLYVMRFRSQEGNLHLVKMMKQ